MIDFPIDELLDEVECVGWLERCLHPEGLRCPRCQASQRRVAQHNGAWLAYRCQRCDRYYTLLTGTVFEKTRQPPSKVVLILRGIAKGESTARLARELKIGRAGLHRVRQQIQHQLVSQGTSVVLVDRVLEADELYQNAGEKKRPPSRSTGSAAPAGQ